MLDAPNNPPNNGSRGFSTGEFRDEYPRIPVARKTINAVHIFSSLSTIYNEIKISINGIK